MTRTPAAFDREPAIEKKLLAWLIIALATVVLMAVAAVQNNTRQAKSAAWVEHSNAFILETSAILSSLHAAEVAQRTYLLAGEDSSKQLAAANFAAVAEHLN